MKKDTLLIAAGRDPLNNAGAVNPPVSRASTIIFPTLEDYHEAEKGNSCYKQTKNAHTPDPSYGTGGTSTVFALQDALATLENGDDCLITSSGLSAITHVLTAFLQSGDHLLVVDSVYGPTRRFCNKTLKKFGVETTYYDPRIGADIASLIQDNTKMIFLESPGSQTFEIQNVPAIVQVAKENNIITILDNSWSSGLFFNPLDEGVDISVQAITKYIGGHSDLLMGAIISKGKNIAKKLLQQFRISGVCVSPSDCYLALRGLRSLRARMNLHQENVFKVVEAVKSIPQVAKILFPADKNSPDYELWKKQFTGTASLFSIVLDKKYSYQEICSLVNSLELFSIGASWGGFESLVLDFNPEASRTATKWDEQGSCIRFYVGLEDADDLVADIKQAFAGL